MKLTISVHWSHFGPDCIITPQMLGWELTHVFEPYHTVKHNGVKSKLWNSILLINWEIFTDSQFIYKPIHHVKSVKTEFGDFDILFCLILFVIQEMDGLGGCCTFKLTNILPFTLTIISIQKLFEIRQCVIVLFSSFFFWSPYLSFPHMPLYHRRENWWAPKTLKTTTIKPSQTILSTKHTGRQVNTTESQQHPK